LKRKAVLGIMLTLLFMGILSLTFDIQPVEAFTISSDYTFTSNIYEPIVVTADNIIIDGAGYTVQGTGSGRGIDLTGRNNVTLKNLGVTNFDYGIRLFQSSNNNIDDNTFSSNGGEGIALRFSSNNTITGNTVSNNGVGIYMGTSSNNTIIGNTVSNNDSGIHLASSSNNNTFTGNIVSNNDHGIYLWSSRKNTIIGNTVSNNEYGGIRLDSSSNNNTVTGNTASSNNDYGIRLDSSSNNTVTGNTASNNTYGIALGFSGNNALFHNNLMNNTQQVDIYPPSIHAWDDGVEGNYWSNYTGVDLDHDGIGDTEHVIDAYNQDNYPLMGMFSDFKATSEYHVQTICNSSISDFQFNGTAICFNVTGEDASTGFCRICVPKALMNETYKVFVNGTEVQCNLLPCSNTTHSYLYFTYNLSTQEVIIIPEFPSFLILPLFMAATLLAVIIIRRKRRADLRVPV